MTDVTVVPKRIGGSLAVFLPAEVVKRNKIKEGVPLRIEIRIDRKPRVLGLLKGKVPYEEWPRAPWPSGQG